MFNAEILPKNHFFLIQVASFVITGYSLPLNFDSNADICQLWESEV